MPWFPAVSKEVLRQRTGDYRSWVEAYARHQNIPIEWAEKGLRKEDIWSICLPPLDPADSKCSSILVYDLRSKHLMPGEFYQVDGTWSGRLFDRAAPTRR
jgi:hypothetical protein